jgi:predicted ATPase
MKEEKICPVASIELKPFVFEDLTYYICDAFKCTPDYCKDLVEVVTRSTHGNPFFASMLSHSLTFVDQMIGQLLSAFYRDGIIFFDPQTRKWRWDLSQVGTKSQLTDNVVDLLVIGIKQLPTEVQELLRIASCVGNSVSLSVLSAITGTCTLHIKSHLNKDIR